MSSRKLRSETENNRDQEEGDRDNDPLVAQQKKTFRRWVNSHLIKRKMEVKHIVNDWDDGILLVALVEIIAETNLGKINLKPKMKLHNLENINRALTFIGHHVKLVNIGSEDVYSHNPNIVLGLLWTLILRWGVKLGDDGRGALLKWVNAKCGTNGGPLVRNFDRDWKNGLKFAALVKAIDPDFDFDDCDENDPLGNMDSAFLHGYSELNIPILLDPSDVVEHPDEKSVMTYVGMFFNEFGKKDFGGLKKIRPIPPSVKNATATTVDVHVHVPEGACSIRVALFSAETRLPVEEFEVDASENQREAVHVVHNLLPDTHYLLIASVVKENGEETDPCSPVEFSTSKLGAPGAPMLSQEGTDSIAVTIPSPMEGAKYFEILVSSPASSKDFSRVVLATDPTTVVSGLTPGTAHAFKVVAVSEKGEFSDPSAPSVGKTLLGSPLHPAMIRVSDVTDSEALVTIQPDRSLLPSGTRLRVQLIDPKDKVCVQEALLNTDHPAAGMISCLLDELLPQTEYHVHVVAITQDGVESNEIEPVSFSTLCTPPNTRRVALVTGGNSPLGVATVRDVVEAKLYGKFDTCFVCVRKQEGETRWEHELLALNSQGGLWCQVELIPYDKRDAESVKQAGRKLATTTLGTVQLVVNNAKLSHSQLACLLHGS